MGKLAREVFFEQNRFIIVPEGNVRSVVDHLPERVHAEKFLRELVPRRAMRHIRTLELVFPPFQTPSTSPFEEWEETLKAVRKHLNLPHLTIRLCFADKGPPCLDEYQLDGLRKLFVKVAWPWE